MSVSTMHDIANTKLFPDALVPKSREDMDSVKGVMKVQMARGFDDMMMAFAIRASVFMVEQAYSYFEDFDGNDAVATHLIGFCGEEPAATLRIRFFGDFAKIERMAVRKEFRATPIAARTIDEAVELIKKKGIRKIYGHASDGRERFWKFSMRKHGVVESIPGNETFELSGHLYHAFSLTLPELPGAITFDTDPTIINRVEGRWHIPSVHEHSGHVV